MVSSEAVIKKSAAGVVLTRAAFTRLMLLVLPYTSLASRSSVVTENWVSLFPSAPTTLSSWLWTRMLEEASSPASTYQALPSFTLPAATVNPRFVKVVSLLALKIL